jgi:hypothetical protein
LTSLLLAILVRAVEHQQLYLHFNHLLTGYLQVILCVHKSVKAVLDRVKERQRSMERAIVSVRPGSMSLQVKEAVEGLKGEDMGVRVYERYLKYLLDQ